MLIIIDSNGELLMFDSHLHGSSGAIVCHAVDATEFISWFKGMLLSNWGQNPSTCSITNVFYD